MSTTVPHTKEFIKTNGIDALASQLDITVKKYPEHDCVVLDYNNNSPKTHPVVMECRGLIMNMAGDTVISRGFSRFFNYGEVAEIDQNFNFQNASIEEKVDGSNIKLYFHPTRGFSLATRGTAFGESNFIENTTFSKISIEAFGVTEDTLIEFCERNLSKDYTYVFEVISPKNRIVTKYEKSEMVLLGIFHNHDDSESQYDRHELCKRFVDNGLNVRVPKQFFVNQYTADAIRQLFSVLREDEEGFVVFDGTNRVKMKTQMYLNLHYLRGNSNITRNRAFEMIQSGDADELLAYFPENKPVFDEVRAAIDATFTVVQGMVDDVRRQNFATMTDVAAYLDEKKVCKSIQKPIFDMIRNPELDVKIAVSGIFFKKRVFDVGFE